MWINAFCTIPFFHDPCFAARLVSVVASSFSLLAIFLLGLWLFSFPVALISSILYLFSPYILLYGRMCMVDTLLGMFAIFVLLFTYLLIEKKEPRAVFALLLGISIGCGFLTKSPGLFLIFPVSLSVFFLRKKKDYSIFLYTFFTFLVAGGLVYVNSLSPQKPIIAGADSIFHHGGFFIFSYIFSSPLEIPNIWIKNICSLADILNFSFPFLIIPFLFLSLIGIRDKKELLLVFFSLFPMFIICFIGTHPFYNYYLFTLLPFFLLIGRALFSLLWRPMVIWRILILSFIFAYPLYFSLYLTFSFMNAPLPEAQEFYKGGGGSYTGASTKEVLSFLKTEVKEPSVLLLTVDWGNPADTLFMYLKDNPMFEIIEAWWWPNKIQYLIPQASSVELAVSKFQQKKAGRMYPERIKKKDIWFVNGADRTSPEYAIKQNPEFRLVCSFPFIDVYKRDKDLR
jgi:4-amino-4-deoxy-L-arabinose transferase-like glycosyltransferase